MTDNNQKRQVACKVIIKDILNGNYVVEEGWTPNYILAGDRKIGRINLIASVIDKTARDNFQSIVLDDGSGQISARWFEKNKAFESINIGDVVLLIGRPREYKSERYLLPEIVKRLDNPEWIKVRKKELEKEMKIEAPAKKQETVVVENIEAKSSEPSDEGKEDPSSEDIISFIKKNDKGDGVDASDIFNIKDGEKILDFLLENGEVFEVKPGRVKVLE